MVVVGTSVTPFLVRTVTTGYVIGRLTSGACVQISTHSHQSGTGGLPLRQVGLRNHPSQAILALYLWFNLWMPTTRQVKKTIRQNVPTQEQIIALVSGVTIGVFLVTVGSFIMAALGVAAAVLSLLFLVFSPVLIPLGVVLFFVTAAVMSTVGFTMAVVSSSRWFYQYSQGHHPVGSENFDNVKRILVDRALHFGEMARDYAHSAQEAAVQVKEQILAAATE
ncbi:hypothetical protein R1sor_026999 [Riccia sorocarpa]|uniref:Oleosin n=1 Tax=Riccia sorocarpa TaxID=122646 RepID=A0ABD3GGN9_9MARC